MDVTINSERTKYIWGIISWQTLLSLPAGVRWLTGSRMNVTLCLIWTHSLPLLWWISSLGAILKSVPGVFHSAQHNEWEQISLMMLTMSRHQEGEGQPGWLALTSNLSVRWTGRVCRPPACLEVQDVPVMVVRLPAKTLTSADHPDPIHNDTRATFDQNKRNHPQGLDNRSLLVLAPSSLQSLTYASCWISTCPCWIKTFPLKAALFSVWVYLKQNRRENIYFVIIKKKKKSAGNEVKKCQDMFLRWERAGRWCGSPFLLSQKPRNTHLPTSLSEQPPPPFIPSVWSAGPCFLLTLLPLKLGVDYSNSVHLCCP